MIAMITRGRREGSVGLAVPGTANKEVTARKGYPILCLPPATQAGGAGGRIAAQEAKHASNRKGKGACYVVERSTEATLGAGWTKRPSPES